MASMLTNVIAGAKGVIEQGMAEKGEEEDTPTLSQDENPTPRSGGPRKSKKRAAPTVPKGKRLRRPNNAGGSRKHFEEEVEDDGEDGTEEEEGDEEAQQGLNEEEKKDEVGDDVHENEEDEDDLALKRVKGHQ